MDVCFCKVQYYNCSSRVKHTKPTSLTGAVISSMIIRTHDGPIKHVFFPMFTHHIWFCFLCTTVNMILKDSRGFCGPKKISILRTYQVLNTSLASAATEM